MSGKRPTYVIKFCETEEENYRGKYYSDSVGWRGVELNAASRLTHKEAETVKNKLHGRLGLAAVVVRLE